MRTLDGPASLAVMRLTRFSIILFATHYGRSVHVLLNAEWKTSPALLLSACVWLLPVLARFSCVVLRTGCTTR